MRSARRAAVLPLAVAVGGVLLASVPAYATVKASWTKPTDNSTFTGYAPIDFAVALDRGTSSVTTNPDPATVNLELTVPGPNPGPFKVDTSSGRDDRDLKFSFTPACPNHAGACPTGAAPAYNGRYTATLTGATSGSRAIVLRIPPAAPTGVSAEATGQHRVKVSWNANREPDLTGYDLFNGEGRTVASNLPASTTSHEFDLPSSGYGGEHKYFVRAHRLACANCSGAEGGEQLSSATSDPATITFTEPTPEPTPGEEPGDGSGGSGYEGDRPPPSPDPSTGPGGGGTGGGNNNGGNGGSSGGGGEQTDENGYIDTSAGSGGGKSSGSAQDAAIQQAQQRLAFGLNFKSFAPKLGAPKLPPLPQFAPPAPEKLPWGTYDPTLNYGDKTVIETVPQASGGGITETFVDSITQVFDKRKLFTSIAGALLMLLAAAHLRLWLRTTPVA